MRIYLMARYSRHEEMQQVAKALQLLGHTVTSRWIWGNHRAHDEAIGTGTITNIEKQIAQNDVFDLWTAECAIGFSEELRTPTRGGRHVELGMALAWGKQVIIVGGYEHVFHTLPQIVHIKDVQALITLLGKYNVRPGTANKGDNTKYCPNGTLHHLTRGPGATNSHCSLCGYFPL